MVIIFGNLDANVLKCCENATAFGQKQIKECIMIIVKQGCLWVCLNHWYHSQLDWGMNFTNWSDGVLEIKLDVFVRPTQLIL